MTFSNLKKAWFTFYVAMSGGLVLLLILLIPQADIPIEYEKLVIYLAFFCLALFFYGAMFSHSFYQLHVAEKEKRMNRKVDIEL